MSDELPVDEQVLNAFRMTEPPVLLPGGEERTYRSGHIVLRRENDGDEAEAVHAAELFASIVEDGFRIAAGAGARRRVARRGALVGVDLRRRVYGDP